MYCTLVHSQPSWAMPRKEGAWPGILVDPCLLSGHACVCCVGVLEGVVSYFPCVNTLHGLSGPVNITHVPSVASCCPFQGASLYFYSVYCTMYNEICSVTKNVVWKISAFSCLARAELWSEKMETLQDFVALSFLCEDETQPYFRSSEHFYR